jgi:hypothetical protein
MYNKTTQFIITIIMLAAVVVDMISGFCSSRVFLYRLVSCLRMKAKYPVQHRSRLDK